MKKAITLIIVLGLVATGFYFYQQYRRQQLAASATNLQTVVAERGSLTATVGATGTVRANQTAILGWQTTGSVDQVNGKVGDQVTSGDILAALGKTSLPQNLILAQADLVNAQQSLEDLYDTDLALAEAEQRLVNAKKALEDAQRRRDSLYADSPETEIESARATVVLLRNQLDQALKKFRPYENKAEDNLLRATYQSRLAEAQKNYDAAVRRLNNLLGTASDTTFSIAESDLALAQAQLVEAQRRYDELKAGPKTNDVTTAQTRIEAAQATLNLAQILAPFDGILTEVQVKPGDQVSPGTVAFRLDDLSHLMVDVLVSEVDINRIRVGQDVTLTFDAILGREYHGAVTQVALVGTLNEGVVDFTVTVELTDADKAVLPGMTAAVNIVVNQLEDILLVPNRAVRVQEGARVVYVLRNGLPEAVNIELGASSETNSEVTGGDLLVGDLIVLNPPVQFEQGGPPPFMGR